MAMRLRKSGSEAAATSVPKTSSRMMSAIGTPMPSPCRRSLSAVWLKSLEMLAVPVDQRLEAVACRSPSCTTACTLSMFFSAASHVAGHDDGAGSSCARRRRSASRRRPSRRCRRCRRRRGRARRCPLQIEDEGFEGRVARRSSWLERTITTSLALIGMSMRSASRSRPTCESGSPRKLYWAVSAPGEER